MYASRDDLLRRFGERSVLELESMHTDGLVATEQALSDASDLIDSYVPASQAFLLSDSRVVEQKCCDIARYNLYMHEPTDEVAKRYDDALKWLRDLAQGKVRLAVDAPTDRTQAVKAAPQVKQNTGGSMSAAFDKIVQP